MKIKRIKTRIENNTPDIEATLELNPREREMFLRAHDQLRLANHLKPYLEYNIYDLITNYEIPHWKIKIWHNPYTHDYTQPPLKSILKNKIRIRREILREFAGGSGLLW